MHTPNTECEEAVIEKIRHRREVGRRKYGTTMERPDLTQYDWLQHAQEEAMDLAIYLERLMREQALPTPHFPLRNWSVSGHTNMGRAITAFVSATSGESAAAMVMFEGGIHRITEVREVP